MKRGEKVGVALAAIVILGVALSPFLLARYWRFYYDDASPELQSKLPAPPECYAPPDVAADGAALADVQAWVDPDGDGERDTDEAHLPGAVVAVLYSDYVYASEDGIAARELATDPEYVQVMGPTAQLTNQEGEASLRLFRAGCVCRCWHGMAIAAWPPAGYEPTTPVLVNLTSNEDVISFGFRKTEP